MNRNQRREQREKESQIQKHLKEQAFSADILKKAEICRKFASDKRHSEFRALFDVLIFNQKFKELLALPKTVKDNDEFVRKGISLITEMNTIKNIFYKPNVFIEAENKIKERAQ